MSVLHQFFGGGFVDTLDVYIELHGETEKAIILLPECDMTFDGNRANFNLVPVRDKSNSARETGRITSRKQLFRIRGSRFSWSAHFFRDAQIRFQNAIRRFNVTVSSA